MPTELLAPASRRARPAPAARPSAAKQLVRSVAAWAMEAAWARKGAVSTALLVATCTGAIAWNALFHQVTRHPSPLFGPPAAGMRPPAWGASTLPSSPPLPVARPRSAGSEQAAAESALPRAAKNDPIGDLIKGGAPTPAPAQTGAPSPDVIAAQKALTRLGYGPLEADGVSGRATRLAIERFEREHGLPATGLLGQRTARALAAAAR
jgi:hypothetical protein